MKRPPKKPKNPLLPEDAQVDDRNLVEAGESADVSLEDRVQMYWMENKSFITGCITLLLVVVAGYQGLRMFMQQQQGKLQSEYAVAAASGDLAAFASDHAGQPLGGFAALQAADAAFGAGDFGDALQYYGIAADALEGTVLAGRARLGVAFATVEGGDLAAGLDELNAIVADASLPEATRAEAGYHLAVQARADGDEVRFDSLATQVEGFAAAGSWGQRLQMFREQAP